MSKQIAELLLDKIHELQNEVKDMQEELKLQQQLDEMYHFGLLVGKYGAVLKDGLVEGGLTEEEASKIMLACVTQKAEV